MQSLIKWYGNAHENKDQGKGHKRDTKSEAEEEDGKGIATRIEQPLRQRGKRGNLA